MGLGGGTVELEMTPRLRGAKRELLDLSFVDGIAPEFWQKILLLVGAIVLAILLAIGCVCLCVKATRKLKKKHAERKLLAHNPYQNEWSASGFASNVGPGAAAPSLANFIAKAPKPDKVEGAEHMNKPSSFHKSHDNEPSESPASSNPAPPRAINGKRVSTRATGNDFGRLDEEAKNRIASIRMNPGIIPIQPAKPSNKALRMLGVEEQAIARPFDDDINTRMRRIAEKAGGNGFGTAAFGTMIVEGFKDKRDKAAAKKEARKERDEMINKRKSIKDEKRRSSVGVSYADAVKKPAPPAEPKVKPGPDKLRAFLASNEGTSASIAPRADVDDDIPSEHSDDEQEEPLPQSIDDKI